MGLCFHLTHYQTISCSVMQPWWKIYMKTVNVYNNASKPLDVAECVDSKHSCTYGTCISHKICMWSSGAFFCSSYIIRACQIHICPWWYIGTGESVIYGVPVDLNTSCKISVTHCPLRDVAVLLNIRVSNTTLELISWLFNIKHYLKLI